MKGRAEGGDVYSGKGVDLMIKGVGGKRGDGERGRGELTPLMMRMTTRRMTVTSGERGGSDDGERRESRAARAGLTFSRSAAASGKQVPL